MLFVWGSGGNRINLGTLQTRHCDVCETERPFHLILQYRYWGLNWIFNFVTEKKYLLLCEVCQRGCELEPRQVEPTLQRVPIPFLHRYGLLTLLRIGLVTGILSSFGGG